MTSEAATTMYIIRKTKGRGIYTIHTANQLNDFRRKEATPAVFTNYVDLQGWDLSVLPLPLAPCYEENVKCF